MGKIISNMVLLFLGFRMLSGSEFLKEQLDVLPELHKELLDEEEEGGKIWMPLTINIVQ